MMGTVFVGAVLICMVCLAIRSMVRGKKQGKCSCGGDCSRCRGCNPTSPPTS